MELFELIGKIERPGNSILEQAKKKMDNKLKPPGSLGTIEDIALKMCVIQNSLDPVIKNRAMLVFAGDHGITIEGVSAYPAEITPMMVKTFLEGKAAINVFCKQNNIDITVVDAGVNFDFEKQAGLMIKKVKKGTNNFLKTSALSPEEAAASIQAGIDAFEEIYKTKKPDLVGTGDMGIGNTTSSSAIIACITGNSPETVTGRGTGIDDERLKGKIEIIRQALSLHKPDKSNGLDVLQKIGGLEIGGIAGTILAASYYKVPVVIDGIISSAGALIAYALNNAVKDYMFAGHKSVEAGQMKALEFLGLKPILDLNMRLGEGTGAALSMNIIEAGCKIMTDMGSF